MTVRAKQCHIPNFWLGRPPIRHRRFAEPLCGRAASPKTAVAAWWWFAFTAVVFARSGLRWAKGAHVSRRTIDGARMSSLRRVQKVLVGLVCPFGRDKRAASSRKKWICAWGAPGCGPCGARPRPSGSYGSGVHRHACGGCARARGRRGWGGSEEQDEHIGYGPTRAV